MAKHNHALMKVTGAYIEDTSKAPSITVCGRD